MVYKQEAILVSGLPYSTTVRATENGAGAHAPPVAQVLHFTIGHPLYNIVEKDEKRSEDTGEHARTYDPLLARDTKRKKNDMYHGQPSSWLCGN